MLYPFLTNKYYKESNIQGQFQGGVEDDYMSAMPVNIVNDIGKYW